MCSECTNVYASLAILSSTTRKQASSCICKPHSSAVQGNTITESEEGIIMLTGYSNNNLLAGKTSSRILNRNTDGSDQLASQMCSKTTA